MLSVELRFTKIFNLKLKKNHIKIRLLTPSILKIDPDKRLNMIQEDQKI